MLKISWILFMALRWLGFLFKVFCYWPSTFLWLYLTGFLIYLWWCIHTCFVIICFGIRIINESLFPIKLTNSYNFWQIHLWKHRNIWTGILRLIFISISCMQLISLFESKVWVTDILAKYKYTTLTLTISEPSSL